MIADQPSDALGIGGRERMMRAPRAIAARAFGHDQRNAVTVIEIVEVHLGLPFSKRERKEVSQPRNAYWPKCAR